MANTSININQLIPITDEVVNSSTGVLNQGGVLLSTSNLIPNNPTQSVLSFTTASEVTSYFGEGSPESNGAIKYFLGYDNSLQKPNKLLISLYIDSALTARMWSGSEITALPAAFAALGSTVAISFTIGGVTHALSVDLTSVTTYSNVATILQAALRAAFTTLTTLTVVYDSTRKVYEVDTLVSGSTSTISYCATGTLATLLQFTLATGAILSQGADVQTPGQNMDTLLSITKNWIGFTNIFDTNETYPDYPIMSGLAEWANAQGTNYAYYEWSTEDGLTQEGNTTNFASYIAPFNYANMVPNFGGSDLACFAMGIGACINYSAQNGVITWAFKQQSGLEPTVTTDAIATQLKNIGWNFYGNYSSKSQTFNWYESGVITGKYKFIDNFYNQVYLANQLQNTIAVMFNNIGKIPNDQKGYSIVKSVIAGVMQQALLNGTIETGLSFSNLQKQELIVLAGYDCSSSLAQAGYVTVITPATPAQRSARLPPYTLLIYTNGGAIQSLPITTVFFS